MGSTVPNNDTDVDSLAVGGGNVVVDTDMLSRILSD